MIPLVIGDAVDLVNPAIQKIFLKGSESETSFYKDFMNVETGVKDYYLKDSSISGLGYAGRITTNAVITSQTPVQGNDKTYTQVNYGILLPVEKKMWYFGIEKRDLTRISNEARKACSDLRELRCAEQVDNMFATSYTASDISGDYSVSTVGGDSAAYVSASHTREDGKRTAVNLISCFA